MTADVHIKLKHPPFIKWKTRVTCERCGEQGQALLVKDVTVPGRLDVYWLCWSCGSSYLKDSYKIAMDILKEHGVKLVDLPIVVPSEN